MARGKRNRHSGATRAPAPETEPATTKPASEPPPEGGLPRGALLGLAALVAVSAVVAFVLLGDGDGGGDEAGGDTAEPAVPWIDPDGQDPIVGAVDVNPADGSVWMSTNTGLFRIPEGSDVPEKVEGTLETGDGTGMISEQLVVRFTGDDELIASGHPPAGSQLPPSLGLVRSTDAGKSWESVSELGKADFHAIQASGETIVAGRYGEPAIDVSSDGGKTFSGKRPPDSARGPRGRPGRSEALGRDDAVGRLHLHRSGRRLAGSASRSRTRGWRGRSRLRCTGSIRAGRSSAAAMAGRPGRTSGRPVANREGCSRRARTTSTRCCSTGPSSSRPTAGRRGRTG